MKTQRISILDGMSVKVRIDATVFSWLQIRFGANHSNLIIFLKRNEATTYFIDFLGYFVVRHRSKSGDVQEDYCL